MPFASELSNNFSMILQWWKDLSVSKKLYSVVGVMALLIATELITLIFAMDILSAVRTFVGGEGLWSKAQKNSIYDLNRYLQTRDETYWRKFQADLEIPRGDHDARIEMEKQNYNFEIVKAGFVRGGNHPEDIPGMVRLIRRFYWVTYIDEALKAWRDADIKIEKVVQLADKAHAEIRSGNPSDARIKEILGEIEEINHDLTAVEARFSNILGEGSRWLESVLMLLLMLAVLTVESTGLILTFSFSRTLSRSLEELMQSAQAVGRGDYSKKVAVHSRDELGQLAQAINKMNDDLENSVGARRQAESASEFKSMFLANMSHEIRTPLGIMVGLSEILKDRSIAPQDHARYVETIERTGKSLTRIINDILDLSKVEAGHLDIQTSKFALAEFIVELQTMLSVQAARTENRLVFTPTGPLPEFVVTDRTRLKQILINLVTNSLKFTHKGTITVVYRYAHHTLAFEVADTGAGIADSNHLFRPFSRTEAVNENLTEGTGLGLVLSQKLARALGGDLILVKSELGKGSTFRATIFSGELSKPVEGKRANGSTNGVSTPPNGETSKLAGRKVLVVEDSADNQLLVRLFLSRKGMNVDFAENGSEGVQKVGENPNYYDFILMDMQMPVMDGYRATEVLRKQGFDKPIIALTAHAMKEDRERCMRVGCSDYLTKPIDSRLLYNAMLEHLD